MFITKGIVVNTGAEFVQDPLYDDRLQIRIPEIHGFGNLVKGFQEKSFTEDKDLPWCQIVISGINIKSKYPIVQYKAQTYGPADIVYVQVDNESPNTNYLVTGLVTKYNEDISDPSLTAYNNIDVQEILNNNTPFPSELIDPDLNGDSSSSGNGGGESTEEGSGTGADNSTVYKYIFGNPFSNKSLYRITSYFPKRQKTSGSAHNGIDLAGERGTPIYSVADGVVMSYQFCNTISREGYRGCSDGNHCGNHLFIDHGEHNGVHYYTMYGHLKSVSVSPGTTVKGTQLISDTTWNNAYKKKSNIEYERLTSEPPDWKNGGWKNYYKQTGTTRNPVYEPVGDKKQEGTEIGKRGNTGDTSGPHLHFTITTKSSEWATRQIPNGYIKNPETYISF